MVSTRDRMNSRLIFRILIVLQPLAIPSSSASVDSNGSPETRKSDDVDNQPNVETIQNEFNTKSKFKEANLGLLTKQVAKLEDAFKEEVAALKQKTMSEDDIEKLHILWAAREHKTIKYNNLEVELKKEIESLKVQNQKQMIRIDKLEEKLKLSHQQQTKVLPTKKDGRLKMPTNCKDLSELGHTLSGFHLVKDRVVKNKLVTMFCSFQSPKILEKQIGYVDVKTFPNGVHFYAQRKTPFTQQSVTVPFDLALIDEGKSLNLTSGIFTAPVPGIYHFSFKGVKSKLTIGYLDIHLRHNGKIIGTAYATFDDLRIGKYANLDVHASLKLKAGDRVDLFKPNEGILDDDSTSPDTHFTGMLLEEELTLLVD